MEKKLNSESYELSQKIRLDSKKIFTLHPEEKYRRPVIGRTIKYPITDYINLKVDQVSQNKKIKLSTFLYLPDKEKTENTNYSGIVYMFHGMGAYSNPGAFIAKRFTEVNCVVAAYDYRGFGFSEGNHGDTEDFKYLIKDSYQFIDETEEYFKNNSKDFSFLKNKFICGISMGGLLCYHLSLERPTEFKGVIYFAPAFDLWQNCFMKGMINLIGGCCPKYCITKPTKESLMCKNPLQFEDQDPIVQNTNTCFRTLKTMLEYMEKAKKTYHNYENPFVIIIPGVDKLVPPVAQLNFFESSKSLDKDLWYYENAWHAMFVEEEIFGIIDRLATWISDRCVF